MMAWCVANCADERKDGETDEQFLYKTRKKAIGPFKRQLWTLPLEPQRTRSAPTCGRSSASSSTSSGSPARASVVERHVTPVAGPAAAARVARRRGECAAVTAGASVFEDDGSGE